jgi:hypothetical protein
VNGLALELANRAEQVATTVHDTPPRAGTEEASLDPTLDEAPGLIEVLADSEDLMPKLGELLEEMTPDIEAVGDLVQAAGRKIERASNRGVGMRAHLVTTEQLAKDLEAPAERLERSGQEFARTLVAVDPGLRAWLDLAQAAPDADDRDEFLASVRGLQEAAEPAIDGFNELIEGIDAAAAFSRSLRRPLQRMRRGLQGVLDGNAIINDWGRRAASIADDGEDLSSGGVVGTP